MLVSSKSRGVRKGLKRFLELLRIGLKRFLELLRIGLKKYHELKTLQLLVFSQVSVIFLLPFTRCVVIGNCKKKYFYFLYYKHCCTVSSTVRYLKLIFQKIRATVVRVNCFYVDSMSIVCYNKNIKTTLFKLCRYRTDKV